MSDTSKMKHIFNSLEVSFVRFFPLQREWFTSPDPQAAGVAPSSDSLELVVL